MSIGLIQVITLDWCLSSTYCLPGAILGVTRLHPFTPEDQHQDYGVQSAEVLFGLSSALGFCSKTNIELDAYI